VIDSGEKLNLAEVTGKVSGIDVVFYGGTMCFRAAAPEQFGAMNKLADEFVNFLDDAGIRATEELSVWEARMAFGLVRGGSLDRGRAVELLRARDGSFDVEYQRLALLDGVAQFERTVASAERSVKQRGAAA
jgi:hypothetical protein